MAAPYRANHQHKVKTHERSEQNVCGESLNRCKPAKRCRKAIEELQKKSITKRCRSGMLCTAFVAKNV